MHFRLGHFASVKAAQRSSRCMLQHWHQQRKGRLTRQRDIWSAQVIHATIVDGAIGVVDPPTLCHDMEYRLLRI
jgi:hypothetical protein